ncbi:MAG: NUDIX hydrolase [Thermodesulfobacteriota bacterium]
MMLEKKYCHACGTRLIETVVEGRPRKFCATCQEPAYENPLPASCLVVADHDDRILLVRRGVEPKIGFWCLPGGFMEIDESPEEAALRELKEETGLMGTIDRLLGVATTPSRMYRSVLMVGYLVIRFEGAPVAGDDAVDIGFFDQRELPEIAFESHRRFMGIYAESSRHR